MHLQLPEEEIPPICLENLDALQKYIRSSGSYSNQQRILVRCPVCECYSHAKTIVKSYFTVPPSSATSDVNDTQITNPKCTSCDENRTAVR